MDTIFEQFFLQNSFPWSKIQLKAKSVRARKHFQALVCIFVYIFQFFSHGKKCAMHKYSQALMCIFVHISHFFLTNCYGYHFRIVFSGEIIPIVKTTIKSKKCARMQELFSIFVHISHFFFKWLFFNTIFAQFLLKNLFPWSKIQLIAKSALWLKHFQELLCIFLHISHFFSIGCLWIPFLNSFCLRIHPHGQKCNFKAKSALLGTFVLFCSYFPLFFKWLLMMHASTSRHSCGFLFRFFTFFNWLFMDMNSFCGRIHSHSPKCARTANCFTFCFTKAKSQSHGQKLLKNGIHNLSIEKSGKYEQKCTKVPKSACARVHFLLLIVFLTMGMISPVKTTQKWYPLTAI